MTKCKQETVQGKQEVVQTFIIRNKETKEVWKADSGKSSWKKPAHAKNAWKGSCHSVPEELRPYAKGRDGRTYSWKETVRFDDQDMFEIIELLPEQKVVTSDDKYKQMVKDIVEMFYGQNFYVANWHYNNDLEPMDNFFEENNWFVEE